MVEIDSFDESLAAAWFVLVKRP